MKRWKIATPVLPVKHVKALATLRQPTSAMVAGTAVVERRALNLPMTKLVRQA